MAEAIDELAEVVLALRLETRSLLIIHRVRVLAHREEVIGVLGTNVPGGGLGGGAVGRLGGNRTVRWCGGDESTS